MAAKKRLRSMPPPPPSFNLWAWLKETSLLAKLIGGAAVVFVGYAGVVRSWADLGWGHKLPASYQYVDDTIKEKIDVNNVPILQGLTDLQLSGADIRLRNINGQIEDLEITKLQTRVASEIVKINSRIEGLKAERDELKEKIRAWKAKGK